jgi:hypothetical protein
MFATWSDIGFQSKTFKVAAKTDLGFRPKDKEEHEIPCPTP